MKAAAEPLVRHLLALRLETPADSIKPAHDLRADLGMDPLDLVLVALDLEDMVRGEFPMADLEEVRTVDDLARLVGEWCDAPPPRVHSRTVVAMRKNLRRAAREWRNEHVALEHALGRHAM